MKKIMIIVFLVISKITICQNYCPGTYVQETIVIDTVPIHKSTYQTGFNCWTSLTDFAHFGTSFPSGIEVAVIITQFNGPVGSIVDHISLDQISLGDTLYLRKNNINYDIQLRHIDYAGFYYEMILFGTPTEYNEPCNCSFSKSGIFYPSNCVNNGHALIGNGSCNTCFWVTLDEKYKSRSFSLYPNPANELIKIDAEFPDQLSFEIVDKFGKQIVAKELSIDRSIDITSLVKGTYLLSLFRLTGEKIHSEIFIKQ